jgi:hypothetical protein
MRLKRTGWILIIAMVLLITSCGGTNNEPKNPLKPPSVYRGPSVEITHAPTEVVLDDLPTPEASVTTTAAQGVVDFSDEPTPTEDDETSLMDLIDETLNSIETRLNQIDTNP